jgi:hypothetical protein
VPDWDGLEEKFRKHGKQTSQKSQPSGRLYVAVWMHEEQEERVCREMNAQYV